MNVTTTKKIYFGDRQAMSVYVAVSGPGGLTRQELVHVVRHSPTGFEWGYEGSGPLDLAYAILADFGSDRLAETAYRGFAATVVTRLPHRGWSVTEVEVANYLASLLGGKGV